MVGDKSTINRVELENVLIKYVNSTRFFSLKRSCMKLKKLKLMNFLFDISVIITN